MLDEAPCAIPLELPAGLEPARPGLEADLRRASERLLRFAYLHGWADLCREPFADRAVFFDDKGAFDEALRRLCDLSPDHEIPGTYSAALEKRILVAVAPDLYAAGYPDGREPAAFEKLLAHEMAHRLHVRLCGGDEDAMGPVWFFEGFAILAAGQFEADGPLTDVEALLAVVRSKERGSYRVYGAAIRRLVERIPLCDWVRHAGEASFAEWAERLVEAQAGETPARRGRTIVT